MDLRACGSSQASCLSLGHCLGNVLLILDQAIPCTWAMLVIVYASIWFYQPLSRLVEKKAMHCMDLKKPGWQMSQAGTSKHIC